MKLSNFLKSVTIEKKASAMNQIYKEKNNNIKKMIVRPKQNT